MCETYFNKYFIKYKKKLIAICRLNKIIRKNQRSNKYIIKNIGIKRLRSGFTQSSVYLRLIEALLYCKLHEF